MKINLILLTILVFSNCKYESVEGSLFEQLQGKWTPYAFEYKNGIINKGEPNSFSSNNIFGVYSAGFQMDRNGDYLPMTWYSDSLFYIKTSEKGHATYLSDESKITFIGTWKLEYKLLKFENNELWLKDNGDIIMKMIRKP